jgi:hypothetical protein
MEGLVVPQPLPACAKRLAPTTTELMKAISVCSGAIAWSDPYSKGITADTRFGNSKATSHAKNDAIPGKRRHSLRRRLYFQLVRTESGLKFNISFCAVWAVSVFFTTPLCMCLPSQNDFFQSPVSG